MSTDIRDAVRRTRSRLMEAPDAARSADRPATAILDGGLRCRVEGPDGSVLLTDMPVPLGGEGSAPTPGWFARAARASCLATRIAMRAAECGIELETVEVVAEGESDLRGLLGLDETVPPGPLHSVLRVRVIAPGVDDEVLRELIEWAEAHSPVSDLVTRAVPSEIRVEREADVVR